LETSPPLGSNLGGYRLEAVLGAGGMGVVYRATDVRAARAVAIKVATANAWTPDRLERFRREGEAASKIASRNVVAVHAAGEEGPWRFLVMELVAGGSLAARIESTGPVPWREAARLGAGIARGLAAIHAAGFVHRDVKPGNVLVGPEGEPKLADFGLSRSLDPGAERLTLTSESVGTVAFMAPEQAEGGKATAASDLYGLGATLHALVSGEAPYASGPAISVLKKKLLEPPPRLKGIPRALEDLVARCLSADPAARGESAAAASRQLEEIAKGAPERRLLLPGLVAATAVASALLVALSSGPQRHPAPEPVAPVTTRPTEPASVSSSARPDLARRWLGVAPSDIAGNKLALDAVLDVTGRERPTAVTSLAAGSELGVAGTGTGSIAVFGLADLTCRAEWRGHNSPVVGVAFTADGKRILTAANAGAACLWALPAPDVREPIWRRRPERYLRGAAITDDQKCAALVSHDGSLLIFDLESGEERAHGRLPKHFLAVAALEGALIAASETSGRVYIWDTNEGELTSDPPRLDLHEVEETEHLPIGTTREGRLLSASHAGVHYTASDRQTRLDLVPSRAEPTAVALSDEGPRGLVADEGGLIRIFDFASATGAREESARLPIPHAATTLAWLRGGQSFLVGTRDGLVLRFVMASRPH